MFSIIVSILCFAYILYLFYLYHYVQKDLIELHKKFFINEIDIVIPFRNERKNLLDLFHSLDAQLNQNSIKYKVFWVNDHSEDDGQNMLLTAIGDAERHKLINLPAGVKGKKEALTYVRPFINAKYVLCLDADVTLPKNYVCEVLPIGHETDLVIGGLRCKNPQGFIEGFAACEHLLLQFLTNGQIKAGKPVLANAANLLMKRSVFLSTTFNFEIKSGDDMDILNNCLKNNNIITTRNLPDAAVTVDLPKTFNQFLQQRIRWVKKVFLKFNFSSISTGLLLSSRHILFFLFILRPSLPLGVYFLLSAAMEYAILNKMSKLLSIDINRRSTVYFLVLFSFYFMLMPLLAFLYGSKLQWKGRKIAA